MPPFTPHLANVVAGRFRVLAEPMRLRILDALRSANGESTVGELVEALGTGQANCSKHLQLLHLHGFVTRRREGTHVWYGIADPAVFGLCDLVCGALARDADSKKKLLSLRR